MWYDPPNINGITSKALLHNLGIKALSPSKTMLEIVWHHVLVLIKYLCVGSMATECWTQLTQMKKLLFHSPILVFGRYLLG